MEKLEEVYRRSMRGVWKKTDRFNSRLTNCSGSSMEPVEYLEEKTTSTIERVLRISLYRQGIKNCDAYIRSISDAKLFELIYSTIKEGE